MSESLAHLLTYLLRYASMPDELTGRMPLAYVQLIQVCPVHTDTHHRWPHTDTGSYMYMAHTCTWLIQILTDGLIFATPFALVHSVGPTGQPGSQAARQPVVEWSSEWVSG